ncbi:ionotropic receptor 93a-like [Daphnia pulicaria]|uniref:ionotropic receptor 93a-like n=1 Tax=Daphnia pulicaria TaxID=35523 RepID=UPI001EEA2392|nr:ionotropic receptor 93a-like [Daphnia pulicaria]
MDFRGSFQIIDYVICVLLSQGAYCGNRQLAIRFAAAAWCLACFVLVQAYSSTLIAFITSPNNKPIINSVYDIEKVPGLKITVNRNFAADLRLLQTNFSIFRKLGDSLREDPSLRCNKTELCLDKVRSGDHVYIHGKPVVQKIISMDREKTGSCHFTMAKESFWPGHLYFFLPKKSPYTETINRGILRMQETGILGKSIETFNPEVTKCSLKYNVKKSGKPRISLKNLTSAFTLLLFGICVSILTLVVELIYHLRHFTSSR